MNDIGALDTAMLEHLADKLSKHADGILAFSLDANAPAMQSVILRAILAAQDVLCASFTCQGPK